MDRRVVARSAAVHVAVIAVVAISGWVRMWFYRPRRFESITVYTVPDVALVTPQPAPTTPTPPAPTPPPPKASEDIPETPKPRVQVSRVKVTRPAPPPPKPAPTAEELKRLLGGERPLKPTAVVGDTRGVSPPDWYLALVRKALYDAWEQPGGIRPDAGLRVIAQIRVARDGTVMKADALRLSGHAVMDASVERALRTVRKLPPLPDSFPGPYRDLQIAFELTGE